MNLASARKSGPSGIKNLRAGRLKQRKKLTTRPCCPEAHVGILFRAPDNVKAQFPQFKAVETYEELMGLVKGAMG